MQTGNKLGLSGRQLAACAVVLLAGLFLNSGCDITTFGNLTTTGTSSGGGSSTTPTVPHLQNGVFTVSASSLVQVQPDVAFFDTASGSARRFLACWVEGASGSNSSAIKAQNFLLTVNGTLQASTQLTLTSTAVAVRLPAVTVLAEPSRITGVVVWQQQNVATATPGPNRIVSSCVVKNGNGLDRFAGVNDVSAVSNTTVQQYSPAVASAGTTLCLVVYLETSPASGEPTLKGRFLDNRGILFSGSPEIDIDHAVGNVDLNTRPSVTFNSSLGEFLVVWGGGGSQNTTVRRATVQANPTKANPVIVTSGEVLVSGASWSGRNPLFARAAYNSSLREYLAVWTEYGTGAYKRVFRHKLDVAATPSTSGAIDLSGNRPNADRPALSFNSILNQYLVVWPDVSATSSGTFDIRARLLGHDTSSNVTNGDEITVASGTVNRTEPAVAFDPIEDNWLVLFTEDGRAIRGQRVKPGR